MVAMLARDAALTLDESPLESRTTLKAVDCAPIIIHRAPSASIVFRGKGKPTSQSITRSEPPPGLDLRGSRLL
jgi:hypothetical protein